MRLIRLAAQHFRNFELLDVSFEPGANIITGSNAQGKTSLLEAVSVLATGTSLRQGDDSVMLAIGHNRYDIKGVYQQESGALLEWHTAYERDKGKNNYLSGKKVNAGHPDRLKVSIFVPDDLNLIKGPPATRRQFLDFALTQVSPEYQRALKRYNSALRRRNMLLRTREKNEKLMKTLEQVIAEDGGYITFMRHTLLRRIEGEYQLHYRQISGEDQEVRLRYALSAPAPASISPESITETYMKALAASKDKEDINRTTLIGPHREDVNIYLAGRIARNFASQGQQRNLAIALKLAEISGYDKIKGVRPVLLMDEVFSELDQLRREYLLDALRSGSFQCIITTVETGNDFFQGMPVYIVESGHIRRVT